uniref:ExbD/TolR family protein n=1 Tax=uncultured Altererythrobacter sp. TaxID=500840 RepID=UPI00260EB71C|nr:biopolymer transporter ExbD [uncultured Altererythrobacter sp.]
MPNTVRRPNLFASRRPMSEMNVTPFIDVLLVLIIMLIMVVPIATHKTEVDLPSGPCADCSSNLIENLVTIDAQDQLYWNGRPMTRDELGANIEYASALEERPLLRFEPDGLASYDLSAKTIALIKDSGAESFAFVGNEKHRMFGTGISNASSE